MKTTSNNKQQKGKKRVKAAKEKANIRRKKCSGVRNVHWGGEKFRFTSRV